MSECVLKTGFCVSALLSALILHRFQDIELAVVEPFLSRCLRFFFVIHVYIAVRGHHKMAPQMHFMLTHKKLRPVPNPSKPCAENLLGLGTGKLCGFLIQGKTQYVVNSGHSIHVNSTC